MEMIILSPTVDFNFESAFTSPNITSSPSSPNNRYFSAPTSPTPTFSPSSFRHFNTSPDRCATIAGSSPSHWEFKHDIPKPKCKSSTHDEDDNFEFHFSKQLEKTSLPAADELFHDGIIKTLKPAPTGLIDPLKSTPLPINAKNWKETMPVRRHEKCDFEKLAAAIEQRRNSLENQNELKEQRERGRERTYNLKSSCRKQRGTRSLSPFSESCKKISNSSTPSKSKDSSSKKWKLRDLWLKKSNKEELKYSVLKKSGGEDVKDSSFRSTESGGGGGSERRRGVAERHYEAKRAAAEEMKKKTVLPYKHGLLGCMGFNFNPGAVHEISRGIDSLTRG